MSGLRLGLRELRRSKVRFGLLTGAVGVLVFLIVFQQALLGALVDRFVGAIERQSADVLVYGDQARRNIQASVVDPAAVTQVAAVDGVAEAGPLGLSTFTVALDGVPDARDAVLIGYDLDGPGAPTTLSEGRLPAGDGEAVAAAGAEDDGFRIGNRLRVLPGGDPIEIVGLADGAYLSVEPAVFVSFETWAAARRAVNPDAADVAPSAVAVHVADGEDPAQLATRITGAVDGVEALDRQTASDESPGVASVNQSLGLVLALTFAIVAVVVGFFFLLLTAQKREALTLLRALGAPAGSLVLALVAQLAVVLAGGIVAGTLLAAGLLVVAGVELDAEIDPSAVAVTSTVVLVCSLLASVGAIRRVLRLQPIAAAMPEAAT